MKDQYFGDFGDYQKISLLKKLKVNGLTIAVYWMKTADDGGTDGKHITYLQKPELWRSYESDIFDFLNTKVGSSKRLLSHIENSSHCEDILFINKNIEDQIIRNKILEEVCTKDTSNVVFFDPDNGIEVASTNKKNIHKYVTWNEIIQTFNSGKSVMIYQHFSRSNREQLIKSKIREIKQRINSTVISIQVKHSVYLFLLQKKHEKKVKKALDEFSKIWKELGIIKT